MGSSLGKKIISGKIAISIISKINLEKMRTKPKKGNVLVTTFKTLILALTITSCEKSSNSASSPVCDLLKSAT